MGRARTTPTTTEMLRVAHMFYNGDKRKSEIADTLGKSIQEITRILSEAKRVGLVKIQIPEIMESDLHDKLRAKFPHIKEALIVSVEPSTKGQATGAPNGAPRPLHGARPDASLLKRLAVVASEYFERLVDQAKNRSLRVGVTGGESLLEFANTVPDRLREHVHFCPTAVVGRGRVPESVYHVDAVAVATVLWSRSGRLPNHCHYASVSPYDTKARDQNARRFIQRTLANAAAMPSIRHMVKQMDAIDVAFAGIGIVNSSGRLTMTCLLEPTIKPQELLEEGAVADFCYNLIDENGRGRDTWRFFLTAGHYSDHPGLAFYQKMVRNHKTVIAIVGPGKRPAIMAALRAKVFNVLISDSESVKEVLNAR